MATFEFTTKTKSSVCSINNGFFFTFSHELYSLSVAALDDTILRALSITQVEHNFNIDVDTDIIIIDSVPFEGATAQQLYDSLETLFFLDESGGGGGGGVLFEGITPPSDTSKLWFNTNDNIIYFYDGSDWVSEQIFEVVFNDQGTTPNNTWFRCGNTSGNDLGLGYNLDFPSKILGISYNRNPSTSQTGNYWLYSNTGTGTENAAVVSVFSVDNSSRGFLSPNVETTINQNKYISMRWNGNQTNNNVLNLKYRKKHV